MLKTMLSSFVLLGCMTQVCFANPADQVNSLISSSSVKPITKSIVNTNNNLPTRLNASQNVGVTVSSGVIADILSITLTQGTWLVIGSATINANAGYSDYVLTWASTTSATFPPSPYYAGATATGTSGFGVAIPPQIFTVASGTQTIYLSAVSGFAGGSGTGTGTITAIPLYIS